jgi:hypothetical protein
MPWILNESPRTHEPIPGAVTRAPLGSLSCPYSSREVVGRQYEPPKLQRSFRSFGPKAGGARNRCRIKAADPWRWCASLTTDYWNPPTSESQHARQRILAVIVAFALAAILAQAGW